MSNDESNQLKSQTATSLVNFIQKITIYETLTNFYIVGSNISESINRVVRINRICDVSTLSINEDQNLYDRNQMQDVITKIITDNIVETKFNPPMNQSYPKKYFAHGLLGFIRFTEGYYMILITKHTPVAIIGYHIVYSVEDTQLIYIPNNSYDKYQLAHQMKEPNMDEQKYLKIFCSIDLKQNFYYSYSYDLTNTLQHNQLVLSSLGPELFESSENEIVGLRNKPCMKFVWNQHLMKPAANNLSYHWIINLIHGFLAQTSINVFGCSVFLTLISRRSQKYAGTRFLKRGGNNQGYVANEVETEQIVHKATVSSFKKGQFTSFVHMRGSIPLFWSQDPKAVPKPPINIDITDPFATVASRHLKQLLSRFGAPLLILNLVKLREKRAQESILAVEYETSIEYVKQFLPNKKDIEYLCLDMAKLNKTEKGNVMNKIYEIAENCLRKTRFYQNFAPIYENEYSALSCKNYNYNPEFNNLTLDIKRSKDQQKFVRQTGIMRVNCVDCLDRTNTAMFVVGKCALAHQLYALGVLTYPSLGQESICERILIELYEKSGDAIAQQYAGSQLVHRVDTYGKNTFASQSRDMIHTISRYYSNTFADADKQNAINLFLGVYKPYLHSGIHLWDLPTDIYLHDSYIMHPWKLSKNYVDWIEPTVFKCLPLAYDQENKSIDQFQVIERVEQANDFRINYFENFYKPTQLVAFHELFYFNNLNRNNSASMSIGGSLKAVILDPFNIRSRKKNESSQLSSLQSLSDRQGNASATSVPSTDDESDDMISSYEIVTKAKNANEETPISTMANTAQSRLNQANKGSNLMTKQNFGVSNAASASRADSLIKLDINETKLNDYRRYIGLNSDAAKVAESSFSPILNESGSIGSSLPSKQPGRHVRMSQTAKQLSKSNGVVNYVSYMEKSYVVLSQQSLNGSFETPSNSEQSISTMLLNAYNKDAKMAHPFDMSRKEAQLCKTNRYAVHANLQTNYRTFLNALTESKLADYQEFLNKPAILQTKDADNPKTREFYNKFISNTCLITPT